MQTSGSRRLLQQALFIRRTVFLPALGMLCLALAGCAGKAPVAGAPAPVTAPVKQEQPASSDIVFRHYKLTFPDSGPPIWQAVVERGNGKPENGKLTLHGIACTLYQHGQPALQVRADDGIAVLQGKSARMQLTGHVHAEEPKHGLTLTATTFHWSSLENQIIATEIHSQGMGYDQQADHGTFTTDLSHAVLSGHIRTATIDFTERGPR